MALTKAAIDRLSYDPNGPKKQIHYDGTVPGFAVVVSPTGVKSFQVQYRRPGSPIPVRLTLGRYGRDLTLVQAREQALKALHNAKHGKDPIEAKQEVRRGEYVRDLVKVYIDREVRHLKSASQVERRINRRILPALGGKRVRDVSTADCARLHYAIGESAPIEANRVRAALHRIMECARKWGYVERTHANPVSDVEPFRETSRERFADTDELAHLWRAIGDEDDLHARVAIRLILLTGCRKNEILTRRWRDVDLAGRRLILPDTKAGKPQTVALSNEALEVMRELPRGLPDAPVFPIADVVKAWNRVRARLWLATHPTEADKLLRRARADVQQRKASKKHASAADAAVTARLLRLALERAKEGEDRLTIHDLRRSVGSLMALHTAPTVIGKALRNPSAVGTYTRIADQEARRALEEHGQRMAAIVKDA